MKKLILVLLGLGAYCLTSFAQSWTGTSLELVHPTLGQNGDATTITRSDVNGDETRLRIKMGDEESSLFEIGYNFYANGQWVPTFTLDGYGNSFLKGRLGIGATAPLSKLHINSPVERETFRIYKEGNTSNYLSMWQGTGGTALDPIGTGLLYLGYDQSTNVVVGKSGGNLGIGTASPIAKLDIRLENPNGWSGDLKALRLASPDNNYFLDVNTYVVSPGNVGYHFSPGNTTGMAITTTGSIGIGTLAPDAKLAVKGVIHSQEVKIDLQGAVAPDYVFEKDYKLPSLNQIKSYIDQHKHLPEVPSAKEMEANGVNLGEMNMLLLRKIEELTLHLITQNEIITELKARGNSPDTSGKKVEELTLFLIEQKTEIENLKEKNKSMEGRINTMESKTINRD